jgi:hypothetical protein
MLPAPLESAGLGPVTEAARKPPHWELINDVSKVFNFIYTLSFRRITVPANGAL